MSDREMDKNDTTARANDIPGEADARANAETPGTSSDEQPTCAICGHPIAQDDLVCPNCGESLVAG